MEQTLKALEALKKENVTSCGDGGASSTLNSGLVAAAAAAHYLNTCLYPHAASLASSSPISASEAAASLFPTASTTVVAASSSSPLNNVGAINSTTASASVSCKEEPITTTTTNIPKDLTPPNSLTSPVSASCNNTFTVAAGTNTSTTAGSNMSPVARLAVAADLLPFLNFTTTSPSTPSLAQQQTNSNVLTAAALLGAMGNANTLGSMGLDANTAATAMLQLAYASNLQSQLNCSTTALRAASQISNAKVSLQ